MTVSSPIWALLTPLQQQLKDQFFSDLEAAKSKKDDAEAKGDDVKGDGTTAEPAIKPKAKPKLQLKKKKIDNDTFASDEEEKPQEKTLKPPSRAASNPPSKAAGKPPSKAGAPVKKPPSRTSTTTKRIREESESDEEVKPKRKAPLKSKE